MFLPNCVVVVSFRGYVKLNDDICDTVANDNYFLPFLSLFSLSYFNGNDLEKKEASNTYPLLIVRKIKLF